MNLVILFTTSYAFFKLFLGNTLYSCNNWAGGLSAIYSLPGASNTHGIRIGSCFAYGAIVFGILIADKGDSLGIGLGVVMIAMVILFLVVVIKLGMDWERFFKGLLPISMPSGSANIVLSLVGTTAIGKSKETNSFFNRLQIVKLNELDDIFLTSLLQLTL